MGGLRGEGAQIMTKRSSQKRTFLKGSQGEALHPRGFKGPQVPLPHGWGAGERDAASIFLKFPKTV
ncbi:hypothetical protein X927_07610 [Petrotoga mexicana DSM 14811]|uniref:Uncharacterized protein n=1 Tax=Petrotoga mexicana DSM 14811 TaxID=1122954 RepID=A0A2K1P7T2_9BACT|nr:hypothetical protein X927_07610 [Petrotoga mexicana DSM 14811]